MTNRIKVFSLLNLEPDQMLTLAAIDRKYGSTRQIAKMGEEGAELAAAVLKHLSDPTPETWNQIIEEMADTFLLVTQVVAHYFTKNDYERFEETKKFKLIRTMEKIK